MYRKRSLYRATPHAQDSAVPTMYYREEFMQHAVSISNRELASRICTFMKIIAKRCLHWSTQSWHMSIVFVADKSNVIWQLERAVGHHMSGTLATQTRNFRSLQRIGRHVLLVGSFCHEPSMDGCHTAIGSHELGNEVVRSVRKLIHNGLATCCRVSDQQL